jgi:hypothetical protein
LNIRKKELSVKNEMMAGFDESALLPALRSVQGAIRNPQWFGGLAFSCLFW